jgi:GLPGLI family protein
MYRLLLFLLLIGASKYPVLSQNQRSGEATYRLNLKLIGHHPSGSTTLYFDQDRSLFRYDALPKKDSIVENGMIIGVIRSDSEGFPIYKDLKKRKSTYKYSGWAGKASKYIVEDTLPTINWSISPNETSDIKGYACQKATGEFGGRTYDVWFTEEIPVSTGPHRLWGLPGLILDAASRDGKVHFSFVGLRFSSEAKAKIVPPQQADGRFGSYAEFVEAELKSMRKREKMANSNDSGGNMVVTMHAPHPDSQIERHEH